MQDSVARDEGAVRGVRAAGGERALRGEKTLRGSRAQRGERAQRSEGAALGEIAALRAKLERVQGRRLDAPVLPTHPALAELLPGGGLRPGAAYSLPPSMSLLLALMARPSQDGTWCGVIGMPEFGAEAAERLGVALERLVLVPDPGPRWLAVAAAVAEVLPVVAIRPPGRVMDAEVARLGARLRDRGAVLLVQGAWPQAEATLRVSEPEWSGLGNGSGYLAGRTLTVTASSKRWPVPRKSRIMLPAPDGTVMAVDASAEVRQAPLETVPRSVAGFGRSRFEPVPREARAVG